jgi:hypothetical protein
MQVTFLKFKKVIDSLVPPTLIFSKMRRDICEKKILIANLLSIPKKGLVAKRIAFHSRVPQVKFLI